MPIPLVTRAKAAWRILTHNQALPSARDLRGATQYSSPKAKLLGSQVDPNARGGALSTFQLLDLFSEIFAPATLCILKRQEQVAGLQFDFVAREGEDPRSPEVQKQIAAARAYIGVDGGLGGRGTSWHSFIRQLIWDLLALDAAPIWRERAPATVVSHRQLWGATIQPLRDDHGWIPTPPDKAFVQWIDGKIVGDYTLDTLSYQVLNPRRKTPYGFPPTEALIMQILSWLRSEDWNLEFFDTGNSADGYWRTPDDWTPEMIKDFYEFVTLVDQSFGGKSPWAPAGPEWISRKRRTDMEWDKLQTRIITLAAAMFGLNATTIGFASETYRTSNDEQIQMARRWGLVPIMLYIAEMMDGILRDIGLDKIIFRWAPEDGDKVKVAQMIRMTGPTVLSTNEARTLLGETRVESALADCLYERTNDGFFVIYDPEKPGETYLVETAGKLAEEKLEAGDEDIEGRPKDDGREDITLPVKKVSRAMQADLVRWREKALRKLSLGEPLTFGFKSMSIPTELRSKLAVDVSHAQSVQDVQNIFAPYLDDL